LNRCVYILSLLVAVVGCQPAATRPTGQPGSPLSSRADSGNALLSSAADQLSNLPTYVDTALRTPSVILDSRRTNDGKDIMAFASSNPNIPNSPVNYIIVESKNARFKTLRVRPGDIVKFYIKEDDTIDKEKLAELKQTGLARLLPIDLTVAQVEDENILLIEGGIDDPELAGKLGKIEVWRFLDDRMSDITNRLNVYANTRLPELGWEPSPDEQALKQIVDRLNQWSRQSNASSDWQLDPLLKTLNSDLLNHQTLAPRLSAEALGKTNFEPHHGRLLQEAVWLRNISRWAPGNRFDDLGRAEGLFDWTVRNIQLEADEAAPVRRPWQVLLHGRGTANQRAWVFALLCRQQGLDVAILTSAEATEPATRFELPAVLIEKQLYVFDARLGLPIRGADGQSIATLEQLRNDDSLLRRLDLSDAPYPLTSAALQNVTANIVADTFELSQAAYRLERKLPRDNRIALSVVPSTLSASFEALPGVATVRLWDVPLETLRDQVNLGRAARRAEKTAFEPFVWRPKLWLARVLHFHGRRRGDDNARSPSKQEPIDDHRDATALYKSPEVRPALRDIARASADKRRIDTISQTYAAYWLGLLLFDDGKYDVAAQWLRRPELLSDDSPWSFGANYSLARAEEAQDKLQEAIELYEADTSPQRHGNRLRAKQLRERMKLPNPTDTK